MAPAYAVARIIAAAAWLTAVAAACSASDEIPHYEYHHLGQFGLKRPAYTSVEKYHGRDALVVSSFGVINGKVSIVPDVAERLDDVAAIKPTTLTDHLIWPNLAQRVPDEAFDIPDLFLVCGGFLVPGAKTGQLTLLDARTNLVGRHELTKDEPGFFYHSAVWFDVNGDGRLDILTAKVNYPYHGEPKGRLLWLENPGHFDQGAWKERALYEGPDVFFRIADLDGDGYVEIVASEFFAKKLVLLWNDDDYADPSAWQSRVIDDSIGAVFDVIVVDLNMDGKFDLLATNHETDSDKSAVFAYELPADGDIRKGEFRRHTIATGFTAGRAKAMAPGSPRPFWPHTDRGNTEKAHILVAGHASEKLHLLRPACADQGNWTYTMETMFDADGMVGLMSVSDVDGDGRSEVFMPSYERDTVHVFAFK